MSGKGEKKTSGRPGSSGSYRALLLRCWQAGERWRYSLEVIGQGRQGFDSLPALMAALHGNLSQFTGPPGVAED